MKKIKKLIFKKVLPVLLVLTLVFTGVIFPFTVSAVIVESYVVAWVGSIAVGILSGMLTQLGLEFSEINYQRWWDSNFEDTVIKETDGFGAVTGYHVNDFYNYQTDYEYSIAVVTCEILNDDLKNGGKGFLKIPGTDTIKLNWNKYTGMVDGMSNFFSYMYMKTADNPIPSVIEREENGAIKESVRSAYPSIKSNDDGITYSIFPKTATNPIPPVISMDEDGARYFLYGEESFIINGTQVFIKDFPYDLNTFTVNKSYLYVVPCFKYNEVLYTLVGYASWNNVLYGNGVIIEKNKSGFWISNYNGFTSGNFNYRNLSTSSGGKVFKIVLENNNIYIRTNEINNPVINNSLANTFCNFETKEVVTLEELGLTKNQVKEKMKFLVFEDWGQDTNILINKKDVTNVKEQEKIIIPYTPIENLYRKSHEQGLVPYNPDITIDNTGAVSIGGVKTETLVKTLEGTGEQDIDLDIELPENQLIDKFPFSLPFDLIRIIKIFVYPEKEPVFTIPIKASFTTGDGNAGIEGVLVEIDEELVLDLTMFKVGDVDIVKILINSIIYVFWALFLIRITPKLQM